MIHDQSTSKQSRNERRLAVERLCTSFELGWCATSQNRITEFLSDVDPSLHDDLISELVALDCELRESNKESPTPQEYYSLLPDRKEEVDRAFGIHAGRDHKDSLVSERTGPSTTDQDVQQIGDYRVLLRLGEGGMGVVYEAVQESLGRRVAIKTLTRNNVLTLIERFEREARAVARLHHTNIVEVYGSGVDDGTPYIAMQLIDGCGLDEIIEDAKDVSNDDSSSHTLIGASGQRFVAKIGLQVAEALEHAHEQGVLHRDIKPANLLIDQKDNAWVSDFGLAKLNNDDSDATVDGSIIGTLRYLPPETFQGRWDERADVYSLGLTLYEALALQPAYTQTEHGQLIDQITRCEPVAALRSINKHVSLDLETLIAKAMSPEPKSRYQSAGAMAADLRRFLNGKPVLARRASAPERLWKWGKRKPALAALLALIATIVSVGFPAMALLWQRAETQRKMAIQSAEDAKSAESEARIAEANALIQKRQAEQAREAAEASRYGSSMMLAQKFLEEGNSVDIARLLGEWVPDPDDPNAVDRRDWEWDYLNQQMDASFLTLRTEHSNAWSVAIRPDDAQIASIHGSENLLDKSTNTVVLWNSRTGEIQHKLVDATSKVLSLAFSPDGNRLATLGISLAPDTRGSLSVWDPQTGEKIKSISLSGEFNRGYVDGSIGLQFLPVVSYSPGGERILTTPGPIELFDANTLEPVWNGKSVECRTATFDQQNNVLAQEDEKIHIVDAETGKIESTQDYSDALRGFRSTSDGTVYSAITRGSLREWPSDKLDQFKDTSVHGTSWGSVSPSGRWLVLGALDGAVTIKPRTETWIHHVVFKGHQSTVTSGAFSQDQKWLATSSMDGTIKAWNMETILHATPLDMQLERTTDIAFADNGNRIVYSSCHTKNSTSAGSVSIDRDNRTAHEIDSTFDVNWPRTDFAFTEDGSMLAAPMSQAESSDSPRPLAKVAIWSTPKFKRQQVIRTSFDKITSLRWNDDNSRLAIAGSSKSTSKNCVSVFRLKDERDLVDEILCAGEVTAIGFRGEQLAIASFDGIDLWHLTMVEELDRLKTRKQHHISVSGENVFLDVSPVGDRLVVANSTNDLFRMFSIDTGEQLYERPAPRAVRCVRFSPNGKRLAVTGCDSHVHFCDAQTGIQLLSLVGSRVAAGTRTLNARVVFSSDGKRIANNNLQAQIAVWSVD